MSETGQIIYSGIDTLRPGDFYFIGSNPGVDRSNRVLKELPLNMENWSAYTQQCWRCGELTGCTKHSKTFHQNNVVALMVELGLRPEDTFATNLIFREGLKPKLAYADVDMNRYWRLHRRLLMKVKPKYIVCLGNNLDKDEYSAFRIVRALADKKTKVVKREQGKFFRAAFNLEGGGITPMVIGVRHPSYPGMIIQGLSETLRTVLQLPEVSVDRLRQRLKPAPAYCFASVRGADLREEGAGIRRVAGCHRVVAGPLCRVIDRH
jgi:hypothetical protein